MIIKNKSTIITIDDNSKEAKKIKDGYNYELKNGTIVITSQGETITNKWQAIQKIKKSKDINELKKVLEETIELLWEK